MPWFWGSSDEKDPVKKIDPNLRDYLEKEAPGKYEPATVNDPAEQAAPQPADPVWHEQDETTPPVPSKSLYPDGRYAHLWKTYVPPAEGTVVVETKSQAGVAAEVSEVRKARHALVKRAIWENCALENETLRNCYRKPETWTQTLTQCDAENRAYNRCWSTQQKFLNALGYATAAEWDDDHEERIQLHADKLYHEMLDFEKRVEEAKEAGQQPPPLTSLFDPQAKTISQSFDGAKKLQVTGGKEIPDGFKFTKDASRLTAHERELEYRAHEVETAYLKNTIKSNTPVAPDRDEKQEKLVGWFGETVGRWLS
ncbi:hypothetical protein BJY04DRAFT_179281 [Aspergillus karnatakaensis]|uniref:uncharacterized protein n=1 Tax=Aspergillus karnatakaensis TaxID=1810916 RepID=UPI003CCE2BC6